MPGSRGRSIRPVRDARGFDQTRALIREYAAGLGFSLDFQDLEGELRDLSLQYSPPSGELLLATVDEAPAGCVGLRAFQGSECEMKRLFVRPRYRGREIGRALAKSIIEVARRAGYRMMLLDTVPSMEAAIRLYRDLGFVETRPYRYNPVPGAVFLRLDLGRGEGRT